MSKILLTAFEPFGIIGTLRGNNTSKEILKEIQAQSPHDFHFLTLPVSDRGMQIMRDTMQRETSSGIVSLGEHLLLPPAEIKIEPYAKQTTVSHFPDLRSDRQNIISSEFAKKMGAAK